MRPSFVFVGVAAAIVCANAQWTVQFNNKCGHGTPLLLENGKTLSTGEPVNVSSGGVTTSTIAFLQTGHCGDNGENCTVVETTEHTAAIIGPTILSDISVAPPHKFSVPAGFQYHGGGQFCDGLHADCASASCPAAEANCQIIELDPHPPVTLEITFCG
ncbi:glycopeptide [Phanerochaete sordida]|uniref:Glycopeptide n=1 Tax=Phanerochaete sordida TaxID=48140 RepID=A0A9P3LJK1_9APHY|nr:glycopeptide [Phanerochaete sordida]